MAWRIHEHVVRGELDCTERGRVSGRIWFAGRNEPVVLALRGCPLRDLAGRRLEFRNPYPRPGLPADFAAQQEGDVGDLTASRKNRVPDVSMDEVDGYLARGEMFPWHWGNVMYLEWFSARNGRVVIEAFDFEIGVTTEEAAWTMTEAEDLEQRHRNLEAVKRFLERLGGGKLPETAAGADPAPDDPFATPKPQTEEAADRMMRDSDALADRIAARLEREGEGADYEKILEEELERRRIARGEKPLTPEEEAEGEKWIEALNRAAEEVAGDPAAPEFEERPPHPLAERARDLSVRLMREIEARGWVPDDAQREHPVAELEGAAMCAAGKLAGALGGFDWPPGVDQCGLTISWLKRARGYLDDALLAADTCEAEQLTEPVWLAATRSEVAALAAEVDALVAALRARLARGFD